MNRIHIALLVLLATAAPAISGVDIEVGNGDKITGTISPAGSTETFRVRVPRGAGITVKAKAAKKGPALSIHLADPAAGGAGDASGKAPTISAVAATSGVFTLTVKSQDGTTAGDYSLSISWKSPTGFFAAPDLAGNALGHLDFAVDAGALVTLSAKPGKGSGATAVFNSLTGPGASVEPLTQPFLQRTFTVTDSYSLAFGNLGAVQGIVAASIKVKPPKAAKRKIALTNAAIGTGDTAFGAVLGSAGGTVTVPALAPGDPGAAISGAAAAIPAGALGGATPIFIATAPPITSLGLKLGAGPTVFFGPEGTTFDATDKAAVATITLPYNASFDAGTADFTVYTRDAKGKVTVVPKPYTFDHAKHTMTCATSHFSSFRVASPFVAQPTGNFNTIATITDPRDVCEGFDTGPMTNGVVHYFVAEGNAHTVAAIRLKLPTGYVRETWVGGGAQTTTPANRTQFQFPGPVVAVYQDVSNFLYCATATQIFRVDPNTAVISLFAGTGAVGDTGDGGAGTQATFTSIRRLFAQQNVGIFVADVGAHRVRFLDVLGAISAFAGDGSVGIGADGGALTTTSFSANGPSAMAAQRNAGIYVADGGRIRWLSKTGPVGPINVTVAGSAAGAVGFGGDDGAPLAATFQSISFMTRSPPPIGNNDDLVLVADGVDHTIREINFTAGTVKLIAGVHGTAGFSGEAGSTPGLLSAPNGLVSTSGLILVSDFGNQRLRLIEVDQ